MNSAAARLLVPPLCVALLAGCGADEAPLAVPAAPQQAERAKPKSAPLPPPAQPAPWPLGLSPDALARMTPEQRAVHARAMSATQAAARNVPSVAAQAREALTIRPEGGLQPGAIDEAAASLRQLQQQASAAAKALNDAEQAAPSGTSDRMISAPEHYPQGLPSHGEILKMTERLKQEAERARQPVAPPAPPP